MPSRSVRSVTALALATSATTFAYVGSAAPAQAAGYDGYCKTSSGVTVVVDFRGLGGGVAIRCSPVGSGATGLDALTAAGIPMTGVRGYGNSVVCQLYGKPSNTCPRMPPASAYWSYWKASNGGSWSYSQEGLSTSHVIPGGFEGWAFAQGSNVAPAAAPSRPSAPKPPPAKPTHTTNPPAPPRHTTTTAPKHTDPAPGTSNGGGTGGRSGGDGGSGSQPKSTASSASSKAAEKKSTKASKSKAAKSKAAKSKAAESKAAKSKAAKSSGSTSTAGATTGSSSGGAANVAGARPNTDDLIKDNKKSSGVNATTVVGGIVLAALVIGGGAVAIVRRRNLG